MKSIFDVVAVRKPARNKFPLTHSTKYSGKMGYLYPAQVTEAYPGDTFTLSPQILTRFAPLISPVMARVKIRRHYFFIPNRILWPEWEDFMAGKSDIGEHPYIDLPNTITGSLADYIGMTPGSYTTGKVNALPFAAYAKVWDEWYRHQDLQAERFKPLVPGSNNANYGAIYNGSPFLAGWGRDYFTSALPTAQQGQPVQLPLTSTSNVPVTVINDENPGVMRSTNGGDPTAPGDVVVTTGPVPLATSTAVGTDKAFYDPNGTLGVSLNANSVTIATLRWAVRMQEFLELTARTGKRYAEMIQVNFNIYPEDSRLQRPEYIGGTTGYAVVSEVLSTAQTLQGDTIANPVGQQAGHAIAINGGNEFKYTCKEHGWIFALDSIIPEADYMQGNHRSLYRADRFDYMLPTFAQLGEQAVYNKEIYAQSPDPDGVFGYNVRYAELKYMPNRVCGEFRTNLDFWHLARKFSAEGPTLSDAFIECDVFAEDLTRIFAVETSDSDHLYVNAINGIIVDRALPKYNVPTL